MKEKLEKLLANYSKLINDGEEINESLLERFLKDWDQFKEIITKEDEKLGEEDFHRLGFKLGYIFQLFRKILGNEIRNFIKEFEEFQEKKEIKIIKKFKLTENVITTSFLDKEYTLYQIVALKDFSDVKAGDLGGYIDKEDTLSHSGDCWIYDKACVAGAFVYENAKIMDNACIYGDGANICGNARIDQNAVIFESPLIRGRADIGGQAKIHGHAAILGGYIHGQADIKDYAQVEENALVSGWSVVRGNAHVSGRAMILWGADVSGDTDITQGTIAGIEISSHRQYLEYISTIENMRVKFEKERKEL